MPWIVSGYVLGYGGLLLLGGRTADLLGRLRTLLTALGVFALASLASGVTSNGTLLIGARFLKGAASAFTAPAGLSIMPPARGSRVERNGFLRLKVAGPSRVGDWRVGGEPPQLRPAYPADPGPPSGAVHLPTC